MAADGKGLMARLRAGLAFTSFVEQYQPLVYRWSVGLLYDRDEAEDVMQEVLFSRIGRWARFAMRYHRRLAVQNHKSRCRQTPSPSKRGARGSTNRRGAPSREVYTTDPGGRVDREQALVLIRESAAALSHRQREVFDLVDLQGYSPVEAGEMLALKPVSVRANLFKARASVRRAILSYTHVFWSYGNDMRMPQGSICLVIAGKRVRSTDSKTLGGMSVIAHRFSSRCNR